MTGLRWTGLQGFKCGHILRIKVIGYADDANLVDDDTTKHIAVRLANFGDTAKVETDMAKGESDMEINMDKTFPQHVFKQKEITVAAR